MKKRLLVILLIPLFSIGTFQYVFSVSTGITGYSGINSGQTCNQCHNGGITPNVNIDGSQFALPGSTQTYRLTISGGQEISGGLNVAVTGGSLMSLGGDTQILNDEITHTSPKSVNSDGEVIFTYSWTAPVMTGTVTMYGAGNSVNGNGTPSGDAPGLATLTIDVVQLDEKVYLPAVLRD